MKAFIFGISFFIFQYSFAGPMCGDLFAEVNPFNPLGDSNLEAQLKSNYGGRNIKAYRQYKKIIQAYPQIEKSAINNGIISVLKDESLSSFHDILQKAFDGIVKNKPTDVMSDMQNRIYEEIVKFMPQDKAKARLKILNQSQISKQDMMQALGQMTLQQSLEALIGKNGIRNLEADSLVARYIEASKAAGVNVKTHVGTFSKGPDYRGRGGEKLFVAVDDRTGPILEKILGQNPHFLMHKHDPGQGTLHMRHFGQDISYARYNHNDSLSYTEENSIHPVVVLSSTEASQTINYFDLGKIENKYSKYPWGFREVDKKNDTDVEYCKAGGYGSCTHWIGEMPIGDKLVSEYSVPGFNDDDGSDQGSYGVDDAGQRRTKKVGKFNVFKSHSGVEKIGFTQRKHRLSRIVWLEDKGREQLWSMVGDKTGEGLARGEWANPGWVIYNFLTRTTQERVPVVFVFRENAAINFGKATLDNLKDEIDPQ